MTQINIIGTIFGTSGYDSHTRNLANALNKQTDVRLSVPLFPGWEAQASDDELLMIKRKQVKNEINLIVNVPYTWKLFTGVGRNWAYCVWEGDKVPIGFIEEFLNPEIEYILVPSNHTKQAILNTTNDKKIINKIKIIHHGVDLDLFKSEKKPKKTTFLCNKGFRNLEDRGGIQYAIQAYLEEFTNEEVELIIKINPAYGIPDLNKLIDEIKPDKEKYPQITIITDNINYNELYKLYNKANVFVSPTRAEAYNIPCIEAMACGLPVITTNFGGQTDFCNNQNGWIIDGKLTEIKHELLYEGISWITPNINELRAKMREAYENDFSQKIEHAKQTAKNNIWTKTAKEVLKLVGQTKKA